MSGQPAQKTPWGRIGDAVVATMTFEIFVGALVREEWFIGVAMFVVALRFLADARHG